LERSSSFAFKKIGIDLASIGNMYGIDCFLEGSIAVLGTKARISVRPMDSQSAISFLNNSFEVEVANMLNLLEPICLKVAEHLRENFGHFHIYDENLKKNIPSLA
jgi:TolB-like protein